MNTAAGFIELGRWMRREGHSIRSFADKTRLDKTTVFRLLHGTHHKISMRLADVIEAATKGEVGLDEMRAYERRVARRQREDA
jgi:hypothetical protein